MQTSFTTGCGSAMPFICVTHVLNLHPEPMDLMDEVDGIGSGKSKNLQINCEPAQI
jgi:hypothetical protein